MVYGPGETGNDVIGADVEIGRLQNMSKKKSVRRRYVISTRTGTSPLLPDTLLEVFRTVSLGRNRRKLIDGSGKDGWQTRDRIIRTSLSKQQGIIRRREASMR